MRTQKKGEKEKHREVWAEISKLPGEGTASEEDRAEGAEVRLRIIVVYAWGRVVL